MPFGDDKLQSALFDTRHALWQDLQIKLKQWEHGRNDEMEEVGKLHTMRNYVRLLDRIEKLARDAGDTYHK